MKFGKKCGVFLMSCVLLVNVSQSANAGLLDYVPKDKYTWAGAFVAGTALLGSEYFRRNTNTKKTELDELKREIALVEERLRERGLDVNEDELRTAVTLLAAERNLLEMATSRGALLTKSLYVLTLLAVTVGAIKELDNYKYLDGIKKRITDQFGNKVKQTGVPGADQMPELVELPLPVIDDDENKEKDKKNVETKENDKKE